MVELEVIWREKLSTAGGLAWEKIGIQS